ncbi:MAG: hypothetical protein Q8K75_05275 [Chlamydiales bacterium]|nr:hypothetical protein [Chlamydiales bacterium]
MPQVYLIHARKTKNNPALTAVLVPVLEKFSQSTEGMVAILHQCGFLCDGNINRLKIRFVENLNAYTSKNIIQCTEKSAQKISPWMQNRLLKHITSNLDQFEYSEICTLLPIFRKGFNENNDELISVLLKKICEQPSLTEEQQLNVFKGLSLRINDLNLLEQCLLYSVNHGGFESKSSEHMVLLLQYLNYYVQHSPKPNCQLVDAIDTLLPFIGDDLKKTSTATEFSQEGNKSEKCAKDRQHLKTLKTLMCCSYRPQVAHLLGEFITKERLLNTDFFREFLYQFFCRTDGWQDEYSFITDLVVGVWVKEEKMANDAELLYNFLFKIRSIPYLRNRYLNEANTVVSGFSEYMIQNYRNYDDKVLMRFIKFSGDSSNYKHVELFDFITNRIDFNCKDLQLYFSLREFAHLIPLEKWSEGLAVSKSKFSAFVIIETLIMQTVINKVQLQDDQIELVKKRFQLNELRRDYPFSETETRSWIEYYPIMFAVLICHYSLRCSPEEKQLAQECLSLANLNEGDGNFPKHLVRFLDYTDTDQPSLLRNVYTTENGYENFLNASLAEVLASYRQYLQNTNAIKDTASAEDFDGVPLDDLNQMAVNEVEPNVELPLLGQDGSLSPGRVARVTVEHIVELEPFDPSQHAQAYGPLMHSIELHSREIISYIAKQGGAFILDLADPDLAAFKAAVTQLGLPDEFLKYAGIYSSDPTSPIYLQAAQNDVDELLMRDIARDFFDAWKRSMKIVVGQPRETLSTAGLVLIEKTPGIYTPLAYTRHHHALELHAFKAEHEEYLTGLMKLEDGKVLTSGAASLEHNPHCIFFNRPHEAIKLSKRRVTGKRVARLVEEPIIAGPARPRSVRDSVNPFKIPAFNSDRIISQRIQRRGEVQRVLRERAPEVVTQVQQVTELPSDIEHLREIAVMQKDGMVALNQQQRVFIDALFPGMFTDEESAKLFSVFQCYQTTSMGPSQLYNNSFFALMVLRILSGQKCLLGLAKSDILTFSKMLIEELDNFEDDNFLCIAWKVTNKKTVPLVVLERLMANQSVNIEFRLQLCNMLSDKDKVRLVRQICEHSSEKIDALQRPDEDFNAAVHRLMKGGDVQAALAYCRTLPVRPIDLMRHVHTASDTVTAVQSARTNPFTITTENILIDLFKAPDRDWKDAHIVTSLYEGTRYDMLYQNIDRRKLVLINDETSIEKQIKLMSFYDIQRATLRIKTLIGLLSHPDGFNSTLYLELLGLLALTKRILKNGQLEDSRIKAKIDTAKISNTMGNVNHAVQQYLMPNQRGGRFLLRGTNDLIFVMPSHIFDLDQVLSDFKRVIGLNGLRTKVLSGKSTKKDRGFSNTGGEVDEEWTHHSDEDRLVTIVTSQVLPGFIPPDRHVIIGPWSAQIPEQIKYYRRGRVTQLVTRKKADQVEAFFGSAQLSLLDKATKDHLRLRAQRHGCLTELAHQMQQAVVSAASSNEELLAILNGHPNEITIEGLRLKPVFIPMDGSCLFNCFIKANLSAELTSVVAWRTHVANYLANRRDEYMLLLGGEDEESIRNVVELYEGPSKETYETMLNGLDDLKDDEEKLRRSLMNLYAFFLKKTDMWGGDLELDAVANMFKLRIVVKGPVGEPQVIEPQDGISTKSIYLLCNAKHFTWLERIA